MSKFENFSQSVDWLGNQLNRFVKFFFRWSTDSSGLLANDSIFCIFGALVQASSSPGAPDELGGCFMSSDLGHFSG